MASTVTLKAAGLNTSPNQLELTEGSLVEAKNVIIRRDNTVEQIRGFRVDGIAMGTSTDRAKVLFEYRDRIFRHYSNVLEFQDGTTNAGITDYTAFSEPVMETETGLRIKKIESNGNLYFTTSEGIKKISTINGAGLSSATITQAGGIKAVDFTAQLQVTDGDQSSFLPQDSAVAYRHIWATKDANDNLIQGTQSQREEVYNSLGELILRDLHTTLRGLDGVSYYSTASLVDDGDYVDSLKLPMTATAVEIQTNLISLALKIDEDILIAEETVTVAPLNINGAGSITISAGVYTINFTSGDPTDYLALGSKIYLTGFTPASGTLDGLQTVSAITNTSLSVNTIATGAVTVGGSATIESGTYRSLVEPAVPGLPATNQELVALQSYLLAIITALQNEPTTGTPPAIDSGARTEWLDPIDITTSAYTKINVTIPDGITPDYFLQLYRSSITRATDAVALDDLVPSDELQLVYEAYPTSAEISAGEMIFNDVTPDEFRGANLYTNPATGEGALQANDLPPYAKDINRFKNVIFFANTRTRHRLQLSLLGVQQMLDEIAAMETPVLSIAFGETAQNYTFVQGEYEVSTVVCDDASTLANSGVADYFEFSSANDEREYYVWYKIGTSTDPAVANKIGIQIQLSGAELAVAVAIETADAIASYPWDFTTGVITDTITITNTVYGPSTNITDVTTGFVCTVTTEGVGEDPGTNSVLLSNQTSVALAVDETARSLIRIINKNTNENVYAYYLSGSNDVPGKLFLESKNLDDTPFYLIANNADTGSSFNPDLTGDLTIIDITTGSSPVIQTSIAHGLTNGDNVVITLTDSTPVIEGVFPIYEVTTDTFTIDLNFLITVGGTDGVVISTANSAFSQNELKPNRVYYSKLSQPEAVPILNFFDVGDADKQILRIFPLRDSMFVFKEEGLYRISGESAPFNLALFDSTCVLTAPDTVDSTDNLIYCLTDQGVQTVSEGGINIVSRAIDNIILRIPVFPDYKTLSFGIGYGSDSSYTLWTVQRASDETATIGFRFSNITNSWTTVDREVSCGFINPVDDMSYHGAGDINYIEKERKTFDRYDYAEREYDFEILNNSYSNNTISFATIDNIAIGDVFVQTQLLSCYEYNMLLKKLDIDMGVADSDYFSTLEAVGGDNLRIKLVDLATKLDADTGVVDTDYLTSIASITKTISAISTANPSVITTTTPHGLLTGRNVIITASDSVPNVNGNWTITTTGASTFTIPTEVDTTGTAGSITTRDTSFEDVEGCYNIIIGKLNTDAGVSFSNYNTVDTETVQEAIVTGIDRQNRRITLNIELPYVIGPLVLFKAIDSAFTYGPNTFGNPISMKHMQEIQMFFENRAFTTARVQFATDLLPELIAQTFNGDGNGIFGHTDGFGDGFFGGGSNAAPFRTWVPRQCQRCRYLTVRFNHAVARESYRIFGTSLTGEDTGSTRAYRS